jgi:hypothetical protein
MFEETLDLLWKAKDYHITTNIFECPSVGYCKGNHIMLEPCDHNFYYEPIPWSLVVV